MRSSWLHLATRSERAGAPVLIWPAPGCDDQVGDERVLGFTGAVRNDGAVAGPASDIEFAMLASMPRRIDRWVGHEHVVANELDAVADAVRELGPAVPVVSAMASSSSTIG
jgi:hypothetical protein